MERRGRGSNDIMCEFVRERLEKDGKMERLKKGGERQKGRQGVAGEVRKEEDMKE